MDTPNVPAGVIAEFIEQVGLACLESGSPLPDFVINHRPGHTVLYTGGQRERVAEGRQVRAVYCIFPAVPYTDEQQAFFDRISLFVATQAQANPGPWDLLSLVPELHQLLHELAGPGFTIGGTGRRLWINPSAWPHRTGQELITIF